MARTNTSDGITPSESAIISNLDNLADSASDEAVAKSGGVFINKTVLTPDSSATVTNKAIDVDNNTVSNLETDNFKTDVVDTDGTLTANSDTRLSSQKAVKTYVDASVAGLKWKDPVDVATTANISLTGEQTIDGVLTSTSRILVKDQTDATENGIYVTAGGGWTRATDMNEGAEFPGAACLVQQGTLNESSAWTCTNTTSVSIGVDDVDFAQFSGTAVYTAGDGIDLVGNQFAVDATVARLAETQTLTNKTINADDNTISEIETDNFKLNVADTDGTLSANSNTRLSTQAAIVTYVENKVSGLTWKDAVVAATTTQVTLATDLEDGDTLDGVVLSTSDRILVKDQGVEDLIDSYTTTPNNQGSIQSTSWSSQTFLTTQAYDIKKVRLLLFRVGNPGTITVSIKATAGDDPTGPDLVSTTLDGNALTTSSVGAWYDFEFASAYSLSNATTYAIVIRATSGDALNKVDIKFRVSSSLYADGKKGVSSDSGSTWAMTAIGDINFETYSVTGNAVENGIYTVNASGAPTRATDFDEDAEIINGTVSVGGGTVNDNTIWTCTNTEANNEVGVDSIQFVQFGGGDSTTAGNGLQKVANEMSIDTAITADLTTAQTLTNKVLDIDNNTLSNVEVDNLKAGVLDTDLTTVSASDDTLASAKGIKAYVDSIPAGAFSTTSNVTSNSVGTLGTDDFVFGSDSLDDDGDTTHDSRMFFDKSALGAFRVGTAQSTQWDAGNRGNYSVAFGYNTTASQSGAVAYGASTTASGLYSLAGGYGTIASNDYAVALGRDTTASASHSASFGSNTIASGQYSTAFGLYTQASGSNATSFGRTFLNNQNNSLAVGYGSNISDTAGTAIRLEADADQDDSKKKAIYIGQTTEPSIPTHRLYNIAKDLKWNGGSIATEVIMIKPIADATALTTGDGIGTFVVPEKLNGYNLVSIGAHVFTVSSSGLPNIMIHNATDTADMLSTAITIDVSEKDSSTATTPAVINTATDDVATGDEIRIDVDGAGTGTAGLEVRFGFRRP